MVYSDGIHLIAESIDELHLFAKSIGLHKCWFHNKAFKPHYDLINKKKVPLKDKEGNLFRGKALQYGALKVSDRQIIKILRANYRMPETDEDVEEFERRHKWELNRPRTEKENEHAAAMGKRFFERLNKQAITAKMYNMSDIKKLEFLSPLETDQFTEEQIAADVFNISFNGEKLKVKMTRPDPKDAAAGPGIELISFPPSYDYTMKKLIGYVIFKIIPRYQNNTGTATGI